MAETTTTAFELPQWGNEETDGPDMAEFNAAFANIEANAAYDDGIAYTSLPTTGLFSKRYVRVTAGTGYSLYRRQSGVWEYIGGTVAPVGQRLAALSGQAGTDKAWTTEQTLGTATSWGTYGGDVVATASLRVSGLFGAAPVGDTLSVTTTGRAYVKTQAAGDLGLVLRAHASTAGNLLTAREQGGSDVLTVDSSGRLVARAPIAVGGGSLSATSVATIAPTGTSGDGILNGLALTGNSADATRDLLRAWSAPGDLTMIAQWRTDGMVIGKLPWGATGAANGSIVTSADFHTWRAAALNVSTGILYQWRLADSDAPSDSSLDHPVWTLTTGSAILGLPFQINQELVQPNDNLTINRFGTGAGRFMTLNQATRVNPNLVTAVTVSDWNTDGRLRTGATWKGSGQLRDARQSIHHVSTKTFADANDASTAGQQIAPSATFTYNFPTMSTRSFGVIDLKINALMELMLGVGQGGAVDAQKYRLECWISINSGAFAQVAYQENAQTSSATGRRQAGDVLNAEYRLQNLTNGSTFQVQLRVVSSTPIPIIYLRKLDIDVEECSFEVYAAA